MCSFAREARLVLLALIALATFAPVVSAAPGDLDSSFATGGIFTAPFMTTYPGAEDSQTVAVDSQGRVYLSATQEPQLGADCCRGR